MGRIIFATGLVGIGSITAIARHQIIVRASACPGYDYIDCHMRMDAQRDAVVIYGLIAALAFIISALIVYSVIRARQGLGQATPPSREATRAARPLPRS